MKLEAYVVMLFKLVAGVETIQSPAVPVPPQRAAVYARAAAYHGQKKSVDPFELLAVARNESDFDEKTIGPDGLDCGLTQTRVTYSRYTCDQLRRSPWLAFSEAARELSAYNQSCAGKDDFDRCRFNRYNSGTRYARRGWAGRYYLRVTCFAEAARRQLPLAAHCRSVNSEDELAQLIARAEERRSPRRREDHSSAVALMTLWHEDPGLPPWVPRPEAVRGTLLGDADPLWLPGVRTGVLGRTRRRRRQRGRQGSGLGGPRT